MDQVKQVLRYHHYAFRTEQTYCDWIVQCLKFFKFKRHPREMGKSEIESFLSYLVTDRKVSASTQRQTLKSIVFFYKHVLDISVSENLEPIKSRKNIRPPVVMTKNEVQRVFTHMEGRN